MPGLRLQGARIGVSLLLLAGASTTATSQAPAAIVVVDMIPKSLSGETNQDSEPFLAVSAADAKAMAASAFTPNPAGSSSGKAPIFVTRDGGQTWVLNVVVPSAGTTADITHASARDRNLYAGILKLPGAPLNELLAKDFLASTPMAIQASRTDNDQPFVRATVVGGKDRVYIGNNDFNGTGDRTATVDVSLDGSASFASARIEARSTVGQDGPSIRPAIGADGVVYAAFFGWRSFNGQIAKSDVVVVRDDDGGSGTNPFTALVDAGDGKPGVRVVKNRSIPWSNAPTLGQERIGSTLSIAVDPADNKLVYVAWCDRTGSDIYTLHVRRSMDGGKTWSADRRRISNATNAALAVGPSGVVGLLYQRLKGTGAASRWETHLEQTKDGFTKVKDTVLANVPGATPPAQFLPYLGDYDFLLAIGNEFRGVFSANNTPDKANFPEGVTYQRRVDFAAKVLKDGAGSTVAASIDPFYFAVPVIP
jgi:hypothetical protein